MTRSLLTYLLLALTVLCSCKEQADKLKAEATAKKKKPFVMKETIATGPDTNMIRFSGIKRANALDVLCQHWELTDNQAASEELVIDENGENTFPELILFNDSTYMENPRSHFQMGTWRIGATNGLATLLLTPKGKKQRYYIIGGLDNRQLELGIVDKKGKPLTIQFSSDGLIHQNKYNDPFHPGNNQWRIPPTHKENDIELNARIKACVKFYALYYRDNLKRHKGDISFLGLPDIFTWYHRGIGLPDKDEVSKTWIQCFYNKEQALRAYDILRDLIVRYEFDWPNNAPDWRYENHTVLEQMYHKMK